MILYVDSIFFLNAVLDWLLLYFTGYLSGVERSWKRLLAAAAAGGAYAVLTLCAPAGLFSCLPMKTAVGAGLLWLVYGSCGAFFRLLGTFFLLSCALAGTVLAAQVALSSAFVVGGAYVLPMKGALLLPAAFFCFFLLALFGRGTGRHQVLGEIVDVEFDLLGRHAALRALRDSGNTLREEWSGAAVLVVQADALAALWPEDLRAELTAEKLRHPEAVLEQLAKWEGMPAMCLFPYRSIGTERGMLLGCRVQHARIGSYRRQWLWIALSPTPVSQSQEYEALWGGATDDQGGL